MQSQPSEPWNHRSPAQLGPRKIVTSTGAACVKPFAAVKRIHTCNIQSRTAVALAQRVVRRHADIINPRHPSWLVPGYIRTRKARAGGILADTVGAAGVPVRVTILDGVEG